MAVNRAAVELVLVRSVSTVYRAQRAMTPGDSEAAD